MGISGLMTNHQQGVCHTCGLAIYIKKYFKAKKRRTMKTQIFHYAKNIIFKKSSKRNQNASRYIITL
jgi:hypothetical protein